MRKKGEKMKKIAREGTSQYTGSALKQMTPLEPVIRAIGCIESRLSQPVDLEAVAKAAGYSKYHLHRIFTKTVGITVHQYIRRRKLTEAARLLTFSNTPIIDIALSCGYESRQAFTAVFKEMYKKTPGQYKKEGFFYPLQLPYRLKPIAAGVFHSSEGNGRVEGNRSLEDQRLWSTAESQGCSSRLEHIRPASHRDITRWMELVDMVIDGYPRLEEKSYKETLSRYIQQNRAMLLEAGHEVIGIMAFDERKGCIDFLGIHPQYKNTGLEELFFEQAFQRREEGNTITITTFRQGDKADTGYRQQLKKLGFTEEQVLVEFGYPTQRMVLTRQDFHRATGGDTKKTNKQHRDDRETDDEG